ncbi:MAG: 6-carboxytetrahydropterin synthase [Bacteroidia bacterium]|nr:6-carboxytetrahydropterin synthase [Bacteroidia bacterium]MBP9688071.1 6-carboxytetrahydropterin synthase [Bacteroidia bacterium]
MLSITKIFRFEAAHAISDYDGACKNIHGHGYELHVAVSTKSTLTNNMIIDFKVLKGIVNDAVINDYDHSLMLKTNSLNLESTHQINTKKLWLADEPTAEIMILDMAAKLQPVMPQNIYLKKLKLYETSTCFVTWEAD